MRVLNGHVVNMKSRTGSRKKNARADLSSFGIGLVFLSFLALLSPVLASRAAGSVLLLLGLYFLSRKKWGSGQREWLAVKVLQSLILVDVGIVLMVVLPGSYFLASLLITLLGLFMFAYLKFRYFAGARPPEK